MTDHHTDAPATPAQSAPPLRIVTDGSLLGGRVRYVQPREGFRSGIEPVLLAAAIPARPGERILEGGTGAGAVLLCLAARVQNLRGLGVERDAALVALAEANAAANGMAGLAFLAADLTALGDVGTFDHALANPPYHDPAGTASPSAARAQAKRADRGTLAAWSKAMGSRLRHRGTLTCILPAAVLAGCLAAMEAADCSAGAVLPLWPKTGRPAKLVLVRGIKGGRAPLRLLPGLVLHQDDGQYTPAADRVLRDGQALDLSPR